MNAILWVLPVVTALAAPTHDIVVEPVALTEAAGSLSAAVNVGAVVSDSLYAEGLQEAADLWGLNLDVFVTANPAERKRLADRLLDSGEYAVILDRLAGEAWDEFRTRAGYLSSQAS